ncbi:MAG: TonB family protein [Luteolibacter sp.]
MTPFLYALNVGTLATWLSVAGFGTVGIAIPVTLDVLQEVKKDQLADMQFTEFTGDFTEDVPASQATDTGTTGEENSEQVDVPFAEQETLPTPPEMPETAEIAPLPEVPDMPDPKPTSEANTSAAPTKERRVRHTNSKVAKRSNMPTSATGGSPQGREGATGQVGNGGRNGGTGMSDAKRLAGGYRPQPHYPQSCRAKGQSGTVVVAFVVEADGKVSTAYAKKPCPWPELNDAAVKGVRRWRFPKGDRQMPLTLPVKFQLNY